MVLGSTCTHTHSHTYRHLNNSMEILNEILPNLSNCLFATVIALRENGCWRKRGLFRKLPWLLRLFDQRASYERVVSWYVPRSRFPPSCPVTMRVFAHAFSYMCTCVHRVHRPPERRKEREKGRSTDHRPGTGCISLYLWARW